MAAADGGRSGACCRDGGEGGGGSGRPAGTAMTAGTAARPIAEIAATALQDVCHWCLREAGDPCVTSPEGGTHLARFAARSLPLAEVRAAVAAVPRPPGVLPAPGMVLYPQAAAP
jgi:hypothetical protein